MIDQIICGDCLEQLEILPSRSVDCCITSPPYYGLRDYGVEGQIGLELSPEAYVARMVEVFREVKRTLKDEGTLWLNLGDSYSAAKTGSFNGGGFKDTSAINGTRDLSGVETSGKMDKAAACAKCGIKPKDLIGIPWMVAFALRADGWYLRSDIIWHKPNCMPESCKDRPTKCHEYLFLLSKSQKYYYDGEAIKEPSEANAESKKRAEYKGYDAGNAKHREKEVGQGKPDYLSAGKERYWPTYRNKRTVWTIPTRPFKEAHFATFPEKLVEPCILAGCPEGGTCLDPFFGAGTVGVVAKKRGRRYIGTELNPEYCEIARRRIAAVPARLDRWAEGSL